jgi:DNA-binding transcriptional LysR family regulator
MDLMQSMRVFVRVVQTKSFKKTAEDFDLPAASITLAVQKLERHLHVRLLHRTTRNVSLTTDGEASLPKIEHLLEEWDALSQKNHDLLSGTIRIDAPTRMARLLLAPHLPQLLEAHPQLHVEMRSTDRAVDLIAEGVDIAIRVGDLHDSGLIARSLGALPLINCASPSYLERMGVPQDVSELDKHAVVQLSSPTSGKILPWEYQEYQGAGKIHAFWPPARVTVNNVETYIACAIEGLGLIQVPAYDVQKELSQQQLVEVLAHQRAPAMAVHALYTHRPHSPKIHLMIDWIQSLLSPTKLTTANPLNHHPE